MVQDKYKVVMLSTYKKVQPGQIYNDQGKLSINKSDLPNRAFTGRHLYIVSDEKIKEGDWYYYAKTKGIGKAFSVGDEFYKDGYYQKIIATTDHYLGYHVPEGKAVSMVGKMRPYAQLHNTGTFDGQVPQIPQSFIAEYVKGGIKRLWLGQEYLLGNKEDDNQNLIPELSLILTEDNEILIILLN